MESIVVSGDENRMNACFQYLQDVASEKFEVAFLTVRNAVTPTALLQVREKNSSCPQSSCATIKMSIVAEGIKIESYKGDWFDCDNAQAGLLDMFKIPKLCKSLFMEAISFYTRK